MKIYDFTAPELAYYKKFCNFDSREAALYDLRAKNIPLEECAEILGYENIRKLSLRVNRKIVKMTDTRRMREWIDTVYWKNELEGRCSGDSKRNNADTHI